MALITFSQEQSGSPVQFTMDKDLIEDLVISKVDGMENPSQAILDFTNKLNWHRVTFVFKHVLSSKRITPCFRNFDVSKKSKLRTGIVSQDEFELVKIIISKQDRSHLVIRKNEIINAEQFNLILL